MEIGAERKVRESFCLIGDPKSGRVAIQSFLGSGRAILRTAGDRTRNARRSLVRRRLTRSLDPASRCGFMAGRFSSAASHRPGWKTLWRIRSVDSLEEPVSREEGERSPYLIRIIFDKPRRLRPIRLEFAEAEIERTQELLFDGWPSQSDH